MKKRAKTKRRKSRSQESIESVQRQRNLEQDAKFHPPTSAVEFHYLLGAGKPRLSQFLLSLDTICLLIIIIVGLSRTLFQIPDLSRVPLSIKTIIGIGFMACVTARTLTILRLIVNRKKIVTNPKYILSARLTFFLCNIISATLFIMVCLYYFGVVDFVAYVLHTQWPKLSEKVSYYISTAIGWIISGIIGNAAYDLLKRIRHKFTEDEVKLDDRGKLPKNKAVPNNSFNRPRN